MQHFFLPGAGWTVGQEIELGALAHQVGVVLRLRAGATLLLLDNAGYAYRVELQSVTRQQVMGVVLDKQPAPGEPALRLTLYQCALKADKFEWVLQKGTELGVARFVPVISQRTIVRPAAALLAKTARWEAIVREAAEQAGRGRLPQLAPPQEWAAAVTSASGPRLLAWEEAGAQVGLSGALPPGTTAASLLIGPEGGLAAEEVVSAQAAGWTVVGLGPRMFAETAALAAVAVLLASVGEMG